MRYTFYIYAFSRCFYPKQLTVYSGYILAIYCKIFFYFISMCVSWESNPQPFALLTQCSTTETQEHCKLRNLEKSIFFILWRKRTYSTLKLNKNNRNNYTILILWINNISIRALGALITHHLILILIELDPGWFWKNALLLHVCIWLTQNCTLLYQCCFYFVYISANSLICTFT